MPTDFTAPPRDLPYPIDHASNLEVVYEDDREPCGLPEFPEDSDERITVLFRLSLNEFVALASAVDVGSDIAYGDDGIKVWWIWVASIMCASFCEEMAECISDPESAFTLALAEALRNNPALAAAIADALPNTGQPQPGRPLTPGQAGTDTLPTEVRDEEGDCIPDALWGASLYLVQSANRAITDFFETLEAASNTLETSAIVAQTIPAAGSYASAAAEFADQIQETLAEGYTAAYTEGYENDLACAIFCLASDGCELTPDDLVAIMEERLGYDPTLDFGVLMARVGTGIFVGGAIADAMMYIYFSAMRFGQQFLDVIGIRALTDLMGLGADQLASDNWETLCDCAEPLTVQVYGILPNFGGTLQDTIEFESGVPFVLDAIEYSTGFFGLAIETDGLFTLAYTINPDPVLPPGSGIVAWLYNDDADTTQFATGNAASASDMPTPVDVLLEKNTNLKGAWWNSVEPFELTITLTAI